MISLRVVVVVVPVSFFPASFLPEDPAEDATRSATRPPPITATFLVFWSAAADDPLAGLGLGFGAAGLGFGAGAFGLGAFFALAPAGGGGGLVAAAGTTTGAD